MKTIPPFLWLLMFVYSNNGAMTHLSFVDKPPYIRAASAAPASQARRNKRAGSPTSTEDIYTTATTEDIYTKTETSTIIWIGVSSGSFILIVGASIGLILVYRRKRRSAAPRHVPKAKISNKQVNSGEEEDTYYSTVKVCRPDSTNSADENDPYYDTLEQEKGKTKDDFEIYETRIPKDEETVYENPGLVCRGNTSVSYKKR